MSPWTGRAALLALLPVLLGAGGRLERAVTPEPAAERELVERINQSRVRRGLPQLELNPKLTEAARAHALQMARQAQVTHRFPDEADLRQRVAATQLRCDLIEENVGVAPDAEMVHQAFLASPGHRDNILQPRANAVGVGAVRTGEDLWVTEDFAQVVPDLEPAQAEEVVAREIAEQRRSARLPPLRRRFLESLRNEACGMAERDYLQARRGLVPSLGGGLQTIAYTTADPALLPDVLRKFVATRRPESFSLGACSGRTATYPSGAYWVVVVFYFPQE